MRAGKLRHRVTIQTRTLGAADSYGHQAKTWADAATVWASVKPLDGAELFRAQQVQPEVTHSVGMRHNANATPKARISHDSRTLEILTAINTEDRDIELELLCKEAV